MDEMKSSGGEWVIVEDETRGARPAYYAREG